MGPEPPFLLIRHGVSFWVERSAPASCSATLQAFREGCFVDSSCYDATGGLWPIASAELRLRPSFLASLLPWRRVPVDIRVGPRAEPDLPRIVSLLGDVLRSHNDFCESLSVAPAELIQRFESVGSPAEVIRVASEHAV